jgi:DDE superfamily endonuclease/Transposase
VSLDCRVGSGRPRKTTEVEDKKIIRYVRHNRFADSNDIREGLWLKLPSTRTIRRRITETGEFISYWVAKKPNINENNRKKRVEWCIKARKLTDEDWAQVIWSDESPFVLRFNNKTRVWRLHNERSNPLVTEATAKQDKKIMVWGCFSWFRVGCLHRIEGIMKKEQYNKILEAQLLPSAQKLYPDGNWIFQQDNEPKHTAKLNKQWIEVNKVVSLDWPAQSPALNPVDNLWSILDAQLDNREPNNQEEVFQVLTDAWNTLNISLLRRLAESLPRRIEAVIAANRYAIGY